MCADRRKLGKFRKYFKAEITHIPEKRHSLFWLISVGSFSLHIYIFDIIELHGIFSCVFYIFIGYIVNSPSFFSLLYLKHYPPSLKLFTNIIFHGYIIINDIVSCIPLFHYFWTYRSFYFLLLTRTLPWISLYINLGPHFKIISFLRLATCKWNSKALKTLKSVNTHGQTAFQKCQASFHSHQKRSRVPIAHTPAGIYFIF